MPEHPIERHIIATPDGHRLYARVVGAPQGMPVVVLHGGPGSGCSLGMAEDFDLTKARVILPDQRGAGLSRPRASVRRNTLTLLVADLERIRQALGIESWIVVGGSWGATLALAYVAKHPGAVRGLVLRGTFVASQTTLRAFFAPRRRLPRRHARGHQSDIRQSTVTRVLHRWTQVFQFGAPVAANNVAMAWQLRERALLGAKNLARKNGGQAARDKYRLQAHVLAQLMGGGGLGPRGVMCLAPALRAWHGPAIAVHGRHDRVCPPAALHALCSAWPALQVNWVDGGHPANQGAMREALRQAIASVISQTAKGQGIATPVLHRSC